MLLNKAIENSCSPRKASKISSNCRYSVHPQQSSVTKHRLCFVKFIWLKECLALASPTIMAGVWICQPDSANQHLLHIATLMRGVHACPVLPQLVPTFLRMSYRCNLKLDSWNILGCSEGGEHIDPGISQGRGTMHQWIQSILESGCPKRWEPMDPRILISWDTWDTWNLTD